MKKLTKIAIIIILVIGILMITVKFEGTENKNINIDIAELSNKLKDESIFEDNLDLIEKEIIIKNYDFNEELIKDAISYIGTGATAEEILVIELYDKSNLNEITSKIEKNIEERKVNYQNYVPKEVDKLENCILKTQGNYIILCVSNDANKAEEIINNYLNN